MSWPYLRMHPPLSLLAGVCILELSLSTVVFAAVDVLAVVLVVDLVVTVVGADVVTFSVVSVEIVKP